MFTLIALSLLAAFLAGFILGVCLHGLPNREFVYTRDVFSNRTGEK